MTSKTNMLPDTSKWSKAWGRPSFFVHGELNARKVAIRRRI